jgi:hypothetical protein
MAAKLWIAVACLLFAMSTVICAQEKKPLTNQDVVAMVLGGLDESTILIAIQASPSDFDVSVPALIDLKTKKVSETLIRAMVTADAQKRGVVSSVAKNPLGDSSGKSASNSPSSHANTPAHSAASSATGNTVSNRVSSTESVAPSAPVRRAPAQFTAFPLDFCAEQFVTLGHNAAAISEGKVYVGNGRLRFESTSQQPREATIIDPLEPIAYVVATGKPVETKTVFQGVRGAPFESGLSKFLLPADPQDPCANWVDVECTAMGAETIQGRSAAKWDLKHSFEDQAWHSYIWVDVRLHIVSKRQFKENTVELRDIVEAPQASGLFALP